MAATKPTVDMPMPPHSSGTSMPRRPSAPISRSRSVGHRASSQAAGARGAISFCAKSRHSATSSRSGSLREKSIRGILWTDRCNRPYTGDVPSDRVPHTFPRFDNTEDERRHRKQRLAAAFRLFGHFGFDEGVAGHITARDPERIDHFWVNPFGMNFKLIRVKDLILVNDHGEVVDGNWPVNTAAFAIHSQVHAARPDVVAAAHAHSVHGKSWSSLRRLL